MAAKSGVYWARGQSPQDMALAIEKYGNRVHIAIKALADYIAQMLQDDMRAHALWEDRTNNARSGLFSVAEKTSETLVTIWLSHGHTVEYGRYLETAHGQQYAIIEPTIQKNMPTIERMLKELLRG